jgi:predicted metal-binding membrane protein
MSCATRLLTRYGRGVRPALEAFKLGAAHGMYCIGCCWALMLIMFVVGTGSLGWMLVLALVMAAEKNHPRGRLLAAPLGIVLLGWSAVMTVAETSGLLALRGD